MARRPRASQLETRTARLKLPVRQKPYAFTTIAPGIALGYRRNAGGGVWVCAPLMAMVATGLSALALPTTTKTPTALASCRSGKRRIAPEL